MSKLYLILHPINCKRINFKMQLNSTIQIIMKLFSSRKPKLLEIDKVVIKVNQVAGNHLRVSRNKNTIITTIR
jgi:hypothetical protein